MKQIEYRKILAAVNEHVNSEISARFAIQLAKEAGCGLCLCFVAEKNLPEDSLRLAEEAANRLFHRAKQLDVPVEIILAHGDPVDEIQKLVSSENIDIVFAATRHEDIEKRFFQGTTARRLSLSLSCSVALVRVVHMGRIHPGKILVPLKAGIRRIQEKAYITSMLARSFDSGVYLLHSTRPLMRFFHGELHLTPDEWETKIPKDISDFINCLDEYGIAHEKKLLPGKTGRNITIEAAARRHDLIIMGASERGLLNSIFKGNPVEEVLRDTPCNLIILKLRHEDT
ncbi:MAG: hypothetical protein C0402_00285 [Thermodesulfovibrio sp.]|nr:hypothetical protein [Thermodesulfovibrio sp.]